MSLAASFEIEYLQYLKPDGTLSGPLPPAVALTSSSYRNFRSPDWSRLLDLNCAPEVAWKV